MATQRPLTSLFQVQVLVGQPVFQQLSWIGTHRHNRMPHGVIGNTTVSEAVVLGSNPSGAANASVAQLDQSTSLRTRRPQVRVLPGVPNDGLIAQLVERLLCKQRVRSSSLRGSTQMLPSSNRSGRHPFTVEIYGFEPRWQYRSILL